MLTVEMKDSVTGDIEVHVFHKVIWSRLTKEFEFYDFNDLLVLSCEPYYIEVTSTLNLTHKLKE